MILEKRIAFQGEFGANSDMACRDLFPDHAPLPCSTFEDAFNVLQAGDADLAMIPIDNTLTGRVADIHLLLRESNLYIVGEYFMPISFQLMVLPGAKPDLIQTVHSHINALAQCRKNIRKNGWRPLIAGDPAGATKLISEWGDGTMAALAPRLSADLYHLDIIEQNVEDDERNVTRFVVLAREPKCRSELDPENRVITTIIFSVRNVPAALYKALGGFATNGVNLTKLESYQKGSNFIATQFYVDIEGHAEDKHVKHAIEELKFMSTEVRILGSYQAHEMRRPSPTAA